MSEPRAGEASLAALLLEHPSADDEPLLHSAELTLSAGAAREEARAVAHALHGLGVPADAAVAVLLPDDAHAIVAMFGVWIAGCVLVPVNARFPPAEAQAAIEATGAAAMISARGVQRLVGTTTYPPGTAFVTWTSGTTGRPKPVLHTHAAYLELLDRVLGPLRGTRRGTGDTRPSPNLVPVPLALNAGIYNVLFGLRAGAEIVVMGRFEPLRFAQLVARFGIRSTVLPPAAMTMLSDDDAVRDLAPLRYVRSITAPLSPLQARRFTEKFGVTVLNGYGQAEIGEVIGWTAADAREHPEKLGAAGRPHPGVAIRVVDPAGGAVGPDEIGRLLVRPPTMAAGYVGGGELGDRLDADGYVDTGDLARVDADGFVWIEGRAGDVINRGGNKVFPDQVEEVLRLAPAVVDAAVVGVPDERLGEVPVAFVVCREAIDDRALEALCRQHLAAYKVPVEFRRVDALPRSDVGKLLRRALLTQGPEGA